MSAMTTGELIAAVSRLVAENPGAPLILGLPDGTEYEIDALIDPYLHRGAIVIPIAEKCADRTGDSRE